MTKKFTKSSPEDFLSTENDVEMTSELSNVTKFEFGSGGSFDSTDKNAKIVKVFVPLLKKVFGSLPCKYFYLIFNT